MIKILASDFNNYHKVDNKEVITAFDNQNGIVNHIKNSLKSNNTILYIPAIPDSQEKVKYYSNLIFESLKLSGITFNEYLILDEENTEKTTEYIEKADMIFLSGGDTYIQNLFFKRINLKENLNSFNGLILGQSAGALNMAEDVFNSPEEMDKSEPIYFKGLGLTSINIEPHFVYDNSNFNEKEKYKRNTILNESINRKIYGQCNGSHILISDNGEIMIYGETYLISNKDVSLICKNGTNRKFKKYKRGI